MTDVESAYQIALRGYRMTEKTGKPHIVHLPSTGDAQRYFVSDPRHKLSSVHVVSGVALTGGEALALLPLSKAYPK